MIDIEHSVAEHIFRAIEDGKEVGRVEYEVSGQVMTIAHTYAYMQGRGIGRMLVVEAIEYARGKGMNIIPRCSYARALMERVEEYREMIL